MVPRCQLLPVASILFGIGLAPAARADVITVTAGRAVVAWDDPSYFELFADGFELGGLFVSVPKSPQGACFAGCAAGTAVDFSAVFGGGARPGSLGSATFRTINGITYTSPQGVYLEGKLVFNAPTVLLPDLDDFEPGTPLRAPFMFRGHVAGFDNGDDLEPRFEVDLTGVGTVLFQSLVIGREYTSPEVTYAFAAPNPVPEPATFFLVGSGLLAIARRAEAALRRRRQ
jgi:hypothetical protein